MKNKWNPTEIRRAEFVANRDYYLMYLPYFLMEELLPENGSTVMSYDSDELLKETE